MTGEELEEHVYPFLRDADDDAPAESNTGPSAATPYAVTTIEELRNRPPVPWIVEDMIQEGEITFWTGARGSRKSLLAVDLGLTLAGARSTDSGLGLLRPTRWAGHDVKACRVLFIALENSGALGERVDARLRAEPDDGNPYLDASAIGRRFVVIDKERPRALEERFQDRIVRTIEDNQADLVIIDTWARFIVGFDPNGERDMSEVIDMLDEVRDRTGATFLIIAHPTKGDGKRATGVRGSAAVEGAAIGVFTISTDESSGQTNLSCEKQNNGPEDYTLRFEMIAPPKDEEGRSTGAPYMRYIADQGAARERQIAARVLDVLAQSGNPMSRNAITEAMGFRRGSVLKVVRELLEQGVLREAPGGVEVVPVEERAEGEMPRAA